MGVGEDNLISQVEAGARLAVGVCQIALERCLVSCQASYHHPHQPGHNQGLPYVTIPTLDNLTNTDHSWKQKRKAISTFFTRASSAVSQTACLHRQMVEGARLGSWGTRSTEDSACCSVHGLRGGRKSGWPWCLIQLITRWSQSRRLEREAGLAGIPPLIPKFGKKICF